MKYYNRILIKMDKVYKSFADLEVWQQARRYRNSIYQLVKMLPPIEKYRMEDQLVRAARSICSNIAEGYGRFTYKDQLHFCILSRGSLNETINDLIDAKDCDYISEETLKQYQQMASQLERILNGYMAWLKRMMNSKSDQQVS